jgi:hypothetical protein
MAQKHHILRLDSENTFEIVKERSKYFTSMNPVSGWQQGTTVIFLKKSPRDSKIGYRKVDAIKKLKDMTEEEKAYL